MTTVPAVINFMAERTGLSAADFTGDRRSYRYSFPRVIAMWLCVEVLPASLPVIGRAFRRDHTTVMHAHKRIQALRADKPEVKYLTDHLRSELRALHVPAAFTHVTKTGRPLTVVAS